MNKITNQFGMAACALILGLPMPGQAQSLNPSTPAAAEARSSGEKPIAATSVPHAKAEQVACINNLKQIGLAARIWSNDEGGHLPKDFISLQKTLQNAGCLICPGDAANKQYANSNWSEMDAKRISYVMVSPGVAETEPQKVFVRCPIHGVALFVDGSVQARPVATQARPVVTQAASTRPAVTIPVHSEMHSGAPGELPARLPVPSAPPIPSMPVHFDLAKLRVGQKLIMPASDSAPIKHNGGDKPASNNPASHVALAQVYTIKAGDTLAKIAEAHGTTIQAIQAANSDSVLPHVSNSTVKWAAPAPSNPLHVESIARGLFDEEINNNPEEAAGKYLDIVAKFDQQRMEAGKAIFRLAECYRKLGRREEAVLLYSRILREFLDQPDIALASQQQLTPLLNQTVRTRRASSSTGIRIPAAPSVPAPPHMVINPTTGMRSASVTSPASADLLSVSESKARQLELLRAELDLVRAQLEHMRNKVKVGVAPQDETFKLERDILALQRQLAAVSTARVELDSLMLPEKEKMALPPEPAPVPPVPKVEAVSAARYGSRLANIVERSEPDYQNDARYREVLRERDRMNQDLLNAEIQMREARDKFNNARWLLDQISQNTNTVTLPKEVENDTRYRELKTAYENLVIQNAGKEEAESQKKIEASIAKIKTWLNKIYLPELKANVEYLSQLRDQSSGYIDRYEQQLRQYEERLEKLKQEILEKAKKDSSIQKF